MSAVAAKPQAGGAMNPTAMGVGVVMLLIILAICWYVSPGIGLMALIGIIIGGVVPIAPIVRHAQLVAVGA